MYLLGFAVINGKFETFDVSFCGTSTSDLRSAKTGAGRFNTFLLLLHEIDPLNARMEISFFDRFFHYFENIRRFFFFSFSPDTKIKILILILESE